MERTPPASVAQWLAGLAIVSVVTRLVLHPALWLQFIENFDKIYVVTF